MHSTGLYCEGSTVYSKLCLEKGPIRPSRLSTEGDWQSRESEDNPQLTALLTQGHKDHRYGSDLHMYIMVARKLKYIYAGNFETKYALENLTCIVINISFTSGNE